MRIKSGIAGVMVVAAALLLNGCTAPPSPSDSPPASTSKDANIMSDADATASVVAYLDEGMPDLAGKDIAYLTECETENQFCQVRLKAVEQAAADMNFKLTTFNAAFSIDVQLRQVQDAMQRGFDGYIYGPVADAAGCANFRMLEETGSPVVTLDSPMCGDSDYTPGTAGYVSMTSVDFYQKGAENAFASCEGEGEGECEAVVLGGWAGTDLFARWQRAIEGAAAAYPNVKIVSNQPADFSAGKGLSVTQDALIAHPGVTIVYTQWDDISRGVEQAIIAAGKVPGEDVRIYSTGGGIEAAGKVADGVYTSTNALLPWEEGYYAAAILAKAMLTGESTAGFTNLAFSPAITDGPGATFITIENVSKFEAQY